MAKKSKQKSKAKAKSKSAQKKKPAATPAPAPTLSNILTVVDYLTKAGWRLKKSTAYKHHEEGKLRPGKDGTYAIAKVDKYAATFLKKLDGTTNDELDRFQANRAQAEMEKTKNQSEHWALRNKMLKGTLVEKGEFERALAQRAATLKVDMEAFIRSGAGGIIKLVGGKADKTPDLIEYMLDEAAGWLNRYAEERDFVVPAATAAALLAKEEQKIDDEEE
jgi:hypothetical protein